MVGPDFEPTIGESKIVIEIRDLIVITQSCDLANAKVQFAALCPIYGLDHFESINPDFTKRGRWESVRKGRVEGLHLLGSPEDPQNITLAPKKLILTRRASEGSASEPSLARRVSMC